MSDVSKLLQNLLEQLANNTAQFSDVLAFIDTHYVSTPTAFTNGNVENGSEQNQGSAKVLGLAKIEGLSEQQALTLFAEHYRNVLDNPTDDAHQNIRQFMQHGWAGVSFAGEPLTAK